MHGSVTITYDNDQPLTSAISTTEDWSSMLAEYRFTGETSLRVSAFSLIVHLEYDPLGYGMHRSYTSGE